MIQMHDTVPNGSPLGGASSNTWDSSRLICLQGSIQIEVHRSSPTPKDGVETSDSRISALSETNYNDHQKFNFAI